MKKDKIVILTGADIKRILYRLANEVIDRNRTLKDIVLIGIQTRGVYLARRLQNIFKEKESIDIPLGILDITLYRDDLTTVGEVPLVKETKIDFDLQGKVVILVDDVLFTGRTVRAALDEIMDFGRPECVLLLVLVDRGHRELPIRADFVGENVSTVRGDIVDVRLVKVDGEDEVVVTRCQKEDERI